MSKKYDVIYTTNFKKSLKKTIKQGKDIDKLKPIIEKLMNKEPLEKSIKIIRYIMIKGIMDVEIAILNRIGF